MSARKEWYPLNPSTKAWGKQKTKTWGHLYVFDISGVHTNLDDGGFPSPVAVSPARKNVKDWSAIAASSHSKNTSQVADDDRASKHDAEDNELKEHNADDDKFRVLIFFSKYT
ncbi:hypothetical protein CQW23_24240 [Capsicum baccatum]|uniref:Uncharacterized protein n=1 Tax=Capsicum baccatum TaxID=33114 RepID=A0A2G2VU79_CAPBA|nr:hypothetical protein CQW23_24240 [Capsicum baccatum]